ncbi:MAG: hypothetical protein ABL916_11405 [Burkholderiaceae bacterium]
MKQERSIEAALEQGEQDVAVARAKKALHSADKGVGVITADDFLADMQQRAQAAQHRIRAAVDSLPGPTGRAHAADT